MRQPPIEGGAAAHLRDVTRYYGTRESRIGYALLLGGTKHFGYYRHGDPAWRLRPAMRRMERQLAERLDLRPGSAVLDAGCGVGDVARALASQPYRLDVTGIDILEANLAVARRRSAARRLPGRTRFLAMDYAALTFPDGSFDGAYTMETLVHSDRIEQVLAGLHRVLRPGGRLVHVEYSRAPADACTPEGAEVLAAINRAAAMPGFDRLEHGLLERLLAGAGFVDVHAEDVTDRMLPMLGVLAALGRPAYALARLLGRPTAVVNAMSGVEFYRHQELWRYKIYTARRP